jgi:hypothetical protein
MRYHNVRVYWKAKRKKPLVGLSQAILGMTFVPEGLHRLRKRLCEAFTEEEIAVLRRHFEFSGIPYDVSEIALPVPPDYFSDGDEMDELECEDRRRRYPWALEAERTIRIGSLEIVGQFYPDQEGITSEVILKDEEKAPGLHFIRRVLSELQPTADDAALDGFLTEVYLQDSLIVTARDRREKTFF